MRSIALQQPSGEIPSTIQPRQEHFPGDWPQPGPIDLELHDLPHASSTTEWWYLKAHLRTIDGRDFSIFAAFFRILKGKDERSGELQYAHSLTWALCDPERGRYLGSSRVDPEAPALGLQKLDRGEGVRDPRLRRAMREVLEKDRIPKPDRLFSEPVFVNPERLELEFQDGNLRKLDDGSYELELHHDERSVACRLRFRPGKAPVRHGDDGVVRGSSGEDMFYYFIPRCEVTGEVVLDGLSLPVAEGQGWYDHEFGRHPEGETHEGKRDDIAWNWCGLQLADGTEISGYTLIAPEDGHTIEERVIVIDTDGRRHDHPGLSLRPIDWWRSTRTFNEYPIRWRLQIPGAEIDLDLQADFPDQEFVTLISKPAFWEGRVTVRGTSRGRSIEGVGFVERSGFSLIDDLDDFFGSVGHEVRRSVRSVYPTHPTYEQARGLIASAERDDLMEGVDIERFARTMIDPVREITDRGGKSWRSYAALACCDIVGGDSREFVDWLALPELLHVGSLIVDDVEDGSTIRRGGDACHLIYGQAHAINAGTAAYFMGQRLLQTDKVSARDRLRLFDLYFEALRAGHAGQALDLGGFDEAIEQAVRTGETDDIVSRILAIHRLKTAAPAAALAKMGAIAGGGRDEQIAAIGRFFDGLGLAFQIIDDVLNLRGFKKQLKARGEDISHGKMTLPSAIALGRLETEQRRWLWDTIASKPTDPEVVEACIELIESTGALDACVEDARARVEDAWAALDPVVEDTLPKLILRAFGWYVLERHY